MIPGETFDSFAARICLRNEAVSAPAKLRTFAALGGEGRVSPAGLLASVLNPAWLRMGDLLENHTMLPLFRPFMDVEGYQRLSALTADGQKSHVMYDTVARPARVCPTCHETELEGIAEAGWHVIHQVRWLWRCQSHKTPLWAVPKGRRQVARVHEVATGCTSRADRETLRAIERDTVWLFGARIPPLGRKNWADFHRAAVAKRFGIKPPYSRAELLKVARRIGPKARAWLGLTLKSQEVNWVVTAICTATGSAEPLINLAMLRVCGIKVATAVMALQGRPSTGGQRQSTMNLEEPM